MGRIGMVLALCLLISGCAIPPHFQGVQSVPIEGMTQVKVDSPSFSGGAKRSH
jgi:hypothetical protein